MKRFFMYCIVIIGALFVGLTFYMFAKNVENIECSVTQGSTIYVNVGETIDLPINHTKKDKRTTIDVASDNTDLISYNSETSKFEAKAGGTATITITPSNENFGPYTFTVRIGNGTTDNPYYISTAEQLKRIGALSSLWTYDDSYEVVANIDLKELGQDGANYCWTPIGTKDKHFTGNFNGGTKTISNLYIDETCELDYVGLFGYVESGAVIERITLCDANIKTNAKNVGAISGYSQGSIQRCKVVNSNISSLNESANVGGISGVVARSLAEAEIAMCQVENSTLNSHNVVGGLVGEMTSGVISNSKVHGIIANDSENIANIAGGIVGVLKADDYTQGDKTFAYNSLIQTNLSIVAFGKSEDALICSNCDMVCASDTLTGDGETDYVGNIVYISDELFSNNKGAKQLLRNDLDKQANYFYKNALNVEISWDFSGTWSLDNKSETDSVGAYIIQDGIGQTVRPLRSGTEVTKSNIIDLITSLMNAGKSDATSKVLDYTYVITEDITVDAKTAFPNGWTPIGNSLRPFNGVIYGQDGHTITIENPTIYSSNIEAYAVKDEDLSSKQKTAGIFGTLSKTASVSQINVKNLIINSDETTYAGGIAGNSAGNVENINIEGLNIKNGTYVGGLVGYNSGKLIHSTVIPSDDLKEIPEGQTEEQTLDTKLNASSSNTIFVGGVAGFNSGIVYICTSEIILSGTSQSLANVGGLVGQNVANAKIEKCAKLGGNSSAGGDQIHVGGIVGTNNGSINNCFSTLSAVIASKNSNSLAGGIAGLNGGDITCSYFSGSIEGQNVGGLVGELSGNVSECYSDAAINGSINIGGLAYKVDGNVKNCYFNATSQVGFGDGNENVFAGFAVLFPEGTIENCYVSVTKGVASNGKSYPETKDFIRSNIAGWWDKTVNGATYGKLSYNVVNTYGFDIGNNNKTSNTLFGSKSWSDDSWKFRTVDFSGEGNLPSATASFFNSDAKFDTTVWNFEGSYPRISKIIELQGIIEDELALPVINVYLGEENSEKVSFVDNGLNITGFESELVVNMAITLENTEEIPATSVTTGDNVEVSAITDLKFTITVKATGTSVVKVALSDGTFVSITVTVE